MHSRPERARSAAWVRPYRAHFAAEPGEQEAGQFCAGDPYRGSPSEYTAYPLAASRRSGSGRRISSRIAAAVSSVVVGEEGRRLGMESRVRAGDDHHVSDLCKRPVPVVIGIGEIRHEILGVPPRVERASMLGK